MCEAGPDARVARAERLQGTAAIEAAGLLPNPSLVAEHQRTLDGPSEHETIVGVSVPLALNGQRGLLVGAAHARAEQAKAAASGTLFDGALQFRQAYATAMADRARVAALGEQQTLLDALSATIAALQRGGETAQYDVLRHRVHARLHQRTLAVASTRAQTSLAWLEAWLGRSVALPATPLRELAGGVKADARLGDAALAQHPDLRALHAEARASALAARAARRRWFPDFELFAGYRGISADGATGHGLALALSVPLTFFDHGQGEAALAVANEALASANEERVRRRYEAQLRMASAQLEALVQSAAELEAVSEEARELIDQTRKLYLAGEASLTELLDALRASEEARLGIIDIEEEIVKVRLGRMRAAGTQLDATLDAVCGGMEP